MKICRSIADSCGKRYWNRNVLQLFENILSVSTNIEHRETAIVAYFNKYGKNMAETYVLIFTKQNIVL